MASRVHDTPNKRKISIWNTFIAPLKNRARPDNFYVNPNKKKVRGWGRKISELDNWGKAIFYPDLGGWNNGGEYTYDRYRQWPWYTFYGERHPPLWFFRELLKQYVSAYDNWDRIFRERNEPYDLQIEIHDSNYILSALECRRVQEWGHKHYYHPPAKVQRTFPINKFRSKKYDLSGFKWELCVEEDVIFESDLKWRERTKESLLNGGYAEYENHQGDVYFAKRTGDVWVGRKVISRPHIS